MMTFMNAFLDEFEKLAAKDADRRETEYRPVTKRGLLMDALKHNAYSGAAGGIGGLAGAGIGAGIGALASNSRRGLGVGAALGGGLGFMAGGLAGDTFSRLRNKKRMIERLRGQGLSEKAVAELASKHGKGEWQDAIPIYGKLRAAKMMRQHLEESGKHTRGLL